MKRILIVAAVAIAIFVAVGQIASFFHFGDKHERVGHFDVYTINKGLPDTSVSSALYYSRRRLTDYLTAYAVDPNDSDRIIFSSDDVYHENESVCGTFLYNGQTRQWIQLRRWPHAAGNPTTWSPDSHYILLDGITVRELSTNREIDLTDYVSKKDGERVYLTPLQWSADSRRLAARVEVSSNSTDRDQDLVEITVSPLTFRYVASIRNSSLAWTDELVRWADGELQVSVPSTSERKIIVKPLDDVTWTPNPPNLPPNPLLHEHFCEGVEPHSR